MNRIELANGTIITSNNYDYVIDSKLGAGATSVVYSAHYTESNGYEQKVILKECYPFDAGAEREDTALVWKNNNKEKHMDAFHNAYRKMMQMQNISGLRNVTSRLFDMFEANNTSYSVMDMNEGRTYDDMADDDLVDTLKTTLAVCKVLEKYHNNGYLHLDIKPSNFLVYEDTRELVVLFDLDSVTSMEDIKSGKVKYVPFSQIYGAPEQAQGQINKLCPATDIFSVGAMLFHKVMGRTVTREDMSVYAEWDFDERKFEKTNPKIKRLLKDIFHKTLAANIKRRCQSVSELIPNLKETIDAANKKQYIVSDYPNSIIKFVGREKELDDIHSLFRNGSTSVFIHGYRGIGKTEVAKKYIEKYKNEYDAVVYVDYDKMNGIVPKIEITNSDEQKSDAKKLKKLCGEENILFVVDNIDAENDDDVNIAISHAEEIMSTGAHVLFTTRNDYSEYYNSEKVIIYPLGKFETEELVLIFKNEYGKTISSEEEKYVEDIIESFDNWTMLIPMITKYIIASGKTILAVKEQLERDGFSSSKEKIPLRRNSEIHRETPNDFLRYMFNLENITENHRMVLRNMYCLNKHKHLSKEKYRLYTYEENLTYLNDMIFFGWVDYDKNTDKLSIQAVLYDLIRTDMEPNRDNVPGIYRYVKEQIEKLNSYEKIEEAKSVTYALLLLTDLAIDYEQEKSLFKDLTNFVIKFFFEDMYSVGALLFDSSEEANWHVNVSYLWPKLLSCSAEIAQKPTSLLFPVHEMFIASYIFSEKFGDTDISVETMLGPLFTRKHLDDFKDNEELLILADIIILSMYATISNICIYNSNGEFLDNDKWYIGDVTYTTYPYYEYMALGIQYVLSLMIENNFTDELIDSFIDDLELPRELQILHTDSLYILLENIIIQIETSLGKFKFWNANKDELLEYNILNVDEYTEQLKGYELLHWSKRAKLWYSSFEKEIENSRKPYNIYNMVLRKKYFYKFLRQSKSSLLDKNKLMDLINNDNRLTMEEKLNLMVLVPAEELADLWKNYKKYYVRTFIKNKHLLSLYSSGFQYVNDWIMSTYKKVPFDKRLDVYTAAIMLKYYYNYNIPNVTEFIANDICEENIQYIVRLMKLVSMIKYKHTHNGAKHLKIKILDLVDNINYSNLPDFLQLEIAYAIKPVAAKFKNRSVLEKLDIQRETISKKYYLPLLTSLDLQKKEKNKIANNFLRDYIKIASLDKYNKVYGIECDLHIDEWIKTLESMSELLQENHNLHRWGNYASVFWPGLYEEKLDESYYRFDPCMLAWECDFELDSKESLGVCFMIAERYHTWKDSTQYGAPWSYPLENALNNWLLGSYENSLTDEEQNDGVAKIIDICPDAAYDIAQFTEEHIEYL